MNGRRQHKRVSLTASATLKLNNIINSPAIKTTVANISLSGICLYSDSPASDDQTISLLISFLSIDGYIHTEIIEGRIVNVIRMVHQYLLGVEFAEEINSERHPRLYEYLRESLS